MARAPTFRMLALGLLCATPQAFVACGGDDGSGVIDPSSTDSGSASDAAHDASTGDGTLGDAGPMNVEVHLVFVHGVEQSKRYADAENDVVDLEAAVMADLTSREPAYEAAHHVKLSATSVHFNLYTDLKGALLSPGLDDGTGEEVATRWRMQLKTKLDAAFPNGEKNIVIVGHSTGARVGFEVAADVGGSAGTPGSATWGYKDRIAGVVSAHGMLDSLASYKTSLGVVSFESACSVLYPKGWCAYASNITAWPAAEWVAKERASLVLTSSRDDCVALGFSLFGEESDSALPLRAQGHPSAVGLALTKKNFEVAHGKRYGDFCHADIADPKADRHAAAVAAAKEQISKWLFESAPRVVNVNAAEQFVTADLDAKASSTPFLLTKTCPASSKAAGLETVARCTHPNKDVHEIASSNISGTPNKTCGGSATWTNVHDFAATGALWLKSYSDQGGLLSTLH